MLGDSYWNPHNMFHHGVHNHGQGYDHHLLNRGFFHPLDRYLSLPTYHSRPSLDIYHPPSLISSHRYLNHRISPTHIPARRPYHIDHSLMDTRQMIAGTGKYSGFNWLQHDELAYANEHSFTNQRMSSLSIGFDSGNTMLRPSRHIFNADSSGLSHVKDPQWRTRLSPSPGANMTQALTDNLDSQVKGFYQGLGNRMAAYQQRIAENRQVRAQNREAKRFIQMQQAQETKEVREKEREEKRAEIVIKKFSKKVMDTMSSKDFHKLPNEIQKSYRDHAVDAFAFIDKNRTKLANLGDKQVPIYTAEDGTQILFFGEDDISIKFKDHNLWFNIQSPGTILSKVETSKNADGIDVADSSKFLSGLVVYRGPSKKDKKQVSKTVVFADFDKNILLDKKGKEIEGQGVIYFGDNVHIAHRRLDEDSGKVLFSTIYPSDSNKEKYTKLDSLVPNMPKGGKLVLAEDMFVLYDQNGVAKDFDYKRLIDPSEKDKFDLPKEHLELNHEDVSSVIEAGFKTRQELVDNSKGIKELKSELNKFPELFKELNSKDVNLNDDEIISTVKTLNEELEDKEIKAHTKTIAQLIAENGGDSKFSAEQIKGLIESGLSSDQISNNIDALKTFREEGVDFVEKKEEVKALFDSLYDQKNNQAEQFIQANADKLAVITKHNSVRELNDPETQKAMLGVLESKVLKLNADELDVVFSNEMSVSELYHNEKLLSKILQDTGLKIRTSNFKEIQAASMKFYHISMSKNYFPKSIKIRSVMGKVQMSWKSKDGNIPKDSPWSFKANENIN